MRKKNSYWLWVKRLKPHWDEWCRYRSEFMKKEREIEEKMRKEFGLDLEFFYVDGGCVGIGVPSNPSSFPLIHDMDLDGTKVLDSESSNSGDSEQEEEVR